MKTMKKGFTLIELLIVIAIIGILAGVILVSTNSARGKANRSAFFQEVKGSVPGILSGCDASATTAVPIPTDTANTTWDAATAESCGVTGNMTFCVHATNVKTFGTTAAADCDVYVGQGGLFQDAGCTTPITTDYCPA